MTGAPSPKIVRMSFWFCNIYFLYTIAMGLFIGLHFQFTQKTVFWVRYDVCMELQNRPRVILVLRYFFEYLGHGFVHLVALSVYSKISF